MIQFYFYKLKEHPQAWWLLAVISARGKLRQEDFHEFKASLDY